MNVQQLAATFFALADPTRRAILARLAKGDATVGELTVPSGMSQPAVSRHIKVLERAGLVLHRRHAQQRPCHLEVKPLMAANAWIEQYRQMWEHMYQQLDALLAEQVAAATTGKNQGTQGGHDR
jgi:DNA-binding transcriptional ArsR family regulator